MTGANRNLKQLARQCQQKNWPENFSDLVQECVGIDLACFYGKRHLKHPVLVAPGQLTVQASQVVKIKESGYAGCILKSAVGEEENGYCSMVFQRKKASWIKTVYDEEDLCGREPIIHWDGRADTRNLDQYLLFARKARSLDDQGFFVGGSLLCHLPGPDEEFHEKEWRFTVGKLQEIGFDTLEIDFCPTLEKESALVEKANILRWYRTVPALVKSVDPGIAVFPKMLNLRWGLDFQLEMASAAVQGGADGLVVANRIYLSELGCTHGGRMLRQQNLLQVREIHRAFPRLPISATGGIYSGRHMAGYLQAGAQNIQLLSYLMGRVKAPFLLKNGYKFQQVLFELFFHPEDGLIPLMMENGCQNIWQLREVRLLV